MYCDHGAATEAISAGAPKLIDIVEVGELVRGETTLDMASVGFYMPKCCRDVTTGRRLALVMITLLHWNLTGTLLAKG